MKDYNYRHILKYTGVFGGVQGLVVLMGLVRNKFMALLLGVNGMGFNSLMVSAQNFASQCTSLGISFSAVPRLSESFEQGDTVLLDFNIRVVRLWSLISAVAGLLFCLLVSPLADSLSFTWGNHTPHYAMLGVAVAMMAIMGGETAIMKATRRLGALARIQLLTAAVGVVAAVPLYYFYGHSGVVPAIVLVAVLSMVATVSYSYRYYPLRISFDRTFVSGGLDMIRLGLAFVCAAAIGSASEMIIRSFLNVEGGLNEVGFYNAAYMIAITYAGLVFSAMESDYFPRLSAVSSDVALTNSTVNRQTEVSLLMLAPMLVALIMLSPVIIPLLFSSEFTPVVALTQLAVLAMFFKVVTMPIAYITLARKRSASYLLLEASYYAVLVVAVMAGYRLWGIWGTGLALVVAHVAELLTVGGYAYCRYQFRSSSKVVRYFAVHLAVGLMAYAVSCTAEGWLYWTEEAALTIASAAYSAWMLRRSLKAG